MALNSTIALLILTSSHVIPSSNGATNHSHPQMVNSSLLIEIVRSLHNLNDFNNFVFFISDRLTKDTHTAAEFFHDFWHVFPTIPITIKVDNTENMDGFLSIPSLCLVLTTAPNDPIMRVASIGLKGLRYVRTLFILFPFAGEDSNEELYETICQIYHWVWRKQFINTALLTIRNGIFIHDPYPEPSIANLTHNWTAEQFFVTSNMDFKGYEIRTPIHHDLPRVFYMTKPRRFITKNHFVSGVSGKLFTSFVEFINATFNETTTNELGTQPVNLSDIIRKVGGKRLEISLHSYTDMLPKKSGTSYPIGINDWCIMVPYHNRTPDHRFIKSSFRTYAWYLVIFSIAYITLGIWFCTPTPQRDLSLSFIQAICSLLLIPPLRVLTLPCCRMRFIFIILFVLGFITTNWYVSKMASFLTASKEPQQINTIADVIAAKLPIMIMSYEYQVLKDYNFPQAFMDLIINATKPQMDMHRDRLNTTYGYSTQTDRWNFINIQQRYLRKPIFRLSDICIGPYYHIYPIQKDSHLARPLQTFILLASDVGLIDHWENEAFADALHLGYVHMMTVDEILPPLSLSFFRSIWLLWAMGVLLSIAVFAFEFQGQATCRKLREFCKLHATKFCNKFNGT
ncbi:uncharacterized protein LOC101891109 [Musca domestica]|uniref:Uncharacterized protein LOC101891109 n=1 Tax=Musca domestica TaxID=7370 RepID=A0A9J7CQE8_MUSDO|nr:uncharacterized protein LOC101891109 [Musca domestica]